jgi:hypothetical protein
MENKFKIRLPFMKNSKAAKASAKAHHLRFGKDPYLDWTVILAAFIAMIVLCGSFAFALWTNVNGGYSNLANSSSSNSTSPVPSLNSAALQKVITIQNEKALAASQYQSGYSGPADPSQ